MNANLFSNKCLLFVGILFLSFQTFAQQAMVASEDQALLDVLVTDMDNKIRPQDKIIFEGKFTKQQFEGISNDEGKFKILLPEGDIYFIKIQGMGSEIDFDQVEIPKQDGNINGEVVVRYQPAQSFNLDDVHFETAKSNLLASSFPTLDELVTVLNLKKDMNLEIAGHTDAIGNDESNLKLSQNRAQAVVDYLIQKGIDSSRLVAKGYGEMEPIASNETDEGRQENRRTEARIL